MSMEIPDSAPPLSEHPDAVVRLLARMLDRALMGDLVAVGVAGVNDDGTLLTAYEDGPKRAWPALIAASSFLHDIMLRDAMGPDRS